MRLLVAVALGPAAWITQLAVGYGLSSYACFPRDAPQESTPPPGWSGETGLLLIINLACLVISLASLTLIAGLLRSAPPKTRTHFLAVCGLYAGVGFAIAILFDTWPILGVPACWSIAA